MSATRHRVAVVGSGIAGLATAYQLRHDADVVLFEADAHFGGHAHTVDLCLDGITHGVDTGFLVFNHRTYPGLTALLAELRVATTRSEMSFSVQVPAHGLEWSGSDLNGVFAQRRNLLRPAFVRMLADLARFNRLATALATPSDAAATATSPDPGRADDFTTAAASVSEPMSIGQFVDHHRFSTAFREWYLLPMLGCIWSCPTDQMLKFPLATMLRFCHNHGLIRIHDRPQWRSVAGGSQQYVQALVRALPDARVNSAVTALRRASAGSARPGVWLQCHGRSEHFDDVVLAGHTDQSLALLGTGASTKERKVLGAIKYQANRAVLHTDSALLPRRPRAWAAWNYERAPNLATEQSSVCLHYLINRLQALPWQRPVIVSLNPCREPAGSEIHGEFRYSHPVFDQAAIDAQGQVPTLQGRSGVWFAGAWTRHGFHEDGLQSATELVAAMHRQWRQPQHCADWHPALQARAA